MSSYLWFMHNQAFGLNVCRKIFACRHDVVNPDDDNEQECELYCFYDYAKYNDDGKQ